MIILVTGATAGFGESITRRFVANGHKVIATGRRQERLQELKDELGDSILTAQLDVRNRAAIEEMIANLPAEWREIDVLVNNAGGAGYGACPQSQRGRLGEHDRHQQQRHGVHDPRRAAGHG